MADVIEQDLPATAPGRQRRARRRIVAGALVTSLAVLGVACGDDDDEEIDDIVTSVSNAADDAASTVSSVADDAASTVSSAADEAEDELDDETGTTAAG
jgi:hypothetical protein